MTPTLPRIRQSVSEDRVALIRELVADGWQQKDVALTVGVSRSYVSMVANDKRRPRQSLRMP